MLEFYMVGDNQGMWDNMKKYVFGGNKFYAGLPTRRVAEYLLFTAKTPEEIQEAYCNNYESINENHRHNFYKLEDLQDIKSRIWRSDTDGKHAINKMIEQQEKIEQKEMERN